MATFASFTPSSGNRTPVRPVFRTSVLHHFQGLYPPSPDQAYTVGIFGDNRSHHDDHQRVVDAMALRAPDLLVNTGDALAFGGSHADWQGFFAIEGELLKSTPLMPCYGNHEAILGEAYWRGYWTLRNSDQDKELNYAFRYGNTHWIQLNSNIEAAKQGEWLTKELKAGADAEFLFVMYHHPTYSFSKHTPNKANREFLHPLWLEHGVDVVFNGHNHCYEHFIIDGLHYVVTGGGGAPLYDIDNHIIPGLEDKRVAARKAFNLVIGEVDGKQAKFTVHDPDAGDVIDTFTIAH